MEPFDAVRLIAGTAALAYAAQSDWRTRRVADAVWVVLGTMGLALFVAELIVENVPADFLLVLVPIAALFYTAFYGQEMFTDRGFRIRWGRLVLFVAATAAVAYLVNAYLAARDPWTNRFVPVLTVPAMLLVVHGLYQVGAIKGGADAKALLAITLLVPRYPEVAGFPLVSLDPAVGAAVAIWFPFALLVLMNTAMLFVVVPFLLLAYNASRGAWTVPEMFLGYRVPIDRVPRFVWLMQVVREGEVVRILRPRDREDKREQVRLLREKGLREVWVTPQLPFMVPLLPGFVLSFVVGNPVFALLKVLT